jgi:hypothetical protein
MPSFIHASAIEWIRWVDSMKTVGDIEMSGIVLFNDTTLEDFQLAYNRKGVSYID